MSVFSCQAEAVHACLRCLQAGHGVSRTLEVRLARRALGSLLGPSHLPGNVAGKRALVTLQSLPCTRLRGRHRNAHWLHLSQQRNEKELVCRWYVSAWKALESLWKFSDSPSDTALKN